MGNLSEKKMRIFTLLGIIFFATPFSYYVYWIYCSIKFESFSEAKENFYNALPSFMDGRLSSAFVFILLGFVAIIFAAMGINIKNQFWHKLSFLIAILSGILTFLNIFQLM